MKIKFEIAIILLHILIGFAISLFKPFSFLYEIGVILFCFWHVFSSKNKHAAIFTVLAYIVGSDVFLRMTGGVVFYEMHKYLLIIFGMIGIFFKGGATRGYQYLIYILLLMPAIFAANYNLEDEVRKLIAFNLAGPVSLAVVSYYTFKRKISFENLNKSLFYFVLPVISMVVYMHFFKASQTVIFKNTASNFSTSGGFGPNQVSTIIGVASFIFLTRLMLTFKFLNLMTVVNLLLFVFMSYRGVLTFSRGGVFSAVISSLFFIFILYYYSNTRLKSKVIGLVILFIVVSFGIWTYTTLKTDGFINKRYAGENAAGVKKDDISSGRGMLAAYEIQAFQENPIFGIGVGKVKYYRYERSGLIAASHNEVTRLMAEHGIFGILALLGLIITPFMVRLQKRSNIYFYSFFLIWFLTINHSATRIAAPAFIYALTLIDIQYEKNSIRRKSIKR